MLNFIPENSPNEVNPSLSFPGFQLDWLDDASKKPKKGKKARRRKKKQKQDRYAQLAFQYGVLASRYDTLTCMIQLAVSAKRRQLDDDLLDDGLFALRPPRITSLPEL